MSTQSNRIQSELPSGDPALLNRVAWARRWSDRQACLDYALAARKKALDGIGRRSRAEQGFALRTLGWHAFWRGDLTLSMEYCLGAEAFLPESEFADARAGIYANLAAVHANRNRFDLAACSIERALWLLQEPEEGPATLADVMLTQASIQRHAGERARAGITLGRARELADGEQLTLVEIGAANLLIDDGDAVKAMEHARAAVNSAESSNNRVALSHARAVLAECLVAHGSLIDAREQVSTALAELDESEDVRARCLMLRQDSRISRANGDPDKALRALKQAAGIAKEQDYAMLRKKIALDRADLLEERGDYKDAVEQHKLAWRLQNETRLR